MDDLSLALLELIGRIYDAALDDALWGELAAALARAFHGSSTTLQLQDLRLGQVALLGLTHNVESAIDAYSSYYWQRDLWVQRGARFGAGRIVTSQELASEDEFERTEYYQDWCRKLDIYHMLGSVLPVEGNVVGVVGIHRPRGGAAYGAEDRRLAEVLFPHLRRAMQLRARLDSPGLAAATALDALERSATAILVADRAGRILHANGRAQTLLRAGDAIRAVQGRLGAGDRAAANRLATLVRDAADTAGGRSGAHSGGTLAIPRRGRLPVTVLVAPFRPARSGFGAPLPAAILFLRDPEAASPDKAVLQEMFGLTPAEAEVAARLAGGQTLQDIAQANGVSLNTIRTQLRGIFTKTGTSRQAQLIALLLGTVAEMP